MLECQFYSIIYSMVKNKKLFIAFIFCVTILFITFLLNLIDWNGSANVKKSKVDSGLKVALEYSPKGVAALQQEIEEAEKLHPSNNGAGDAQDSMSRIRKSMSNSIIIGDSITEGFKAYGFLDDNVVFSKIGASLTTVDDLFESAAESKPECLFLAFGMNDLGNLAANTDDFEKLYTKKINSFIKSSPKSKVILLTIVPPSESAISEKPILKNYDKYNKVIYKIADKKKLQVIDTVKIMRDHPDLHEPDGIHVSTSFYPIVLNQMIVKAGLNK